jgi:hypothetical protein
MTLVVARLQSVKEKTKDNNKELKRSERKIEDVFGQIILVLEEEK